MQAVHRFQCSAEQKQPSATRTTGNPQMDVWCMPSKEQCEKCSGTWYDYPGLGEYWTIIRSADVATALPYENDKGGNPECMQGVVMMDQQCISYWDLPWDYRCATVMSISLPLGRGTEDAFAAGVMHGRLGTPTRRQTSVILTTLYFARTIRIRMALVMTARTSKVQAFSTCRTHLLGSTGYRPRGACHIPLLRVARHRWPGPADEMV